MFVKINEKEYELSTKLGTAMTLEKKHKISIMQLFEKLQNADVCELIDMIDIAAKQVNKDSEIKNDLLAHYDYMDLFLLVKDLLIKILFSGTDKQNEEKLAKFPINEEAKNAIRELLGLPTTADSAGTA